MRPTIRSLTVSFTLLLGLVTYSLANADGRHDARVNNAQAVLTEK